MTTQEAIQPVRNESFGLVWMLAIRSIGLTAGVAVAMLLVAALISR
jgi:hypothetical protein